MVEVRNVVVDPYGRPRRAKPPSTQAVRRQDAVSRTVHCEACLITYTVGSGEAPTCPLCDATRRVRDLQGAMASMRNQMDLMGTELSRLRALTDVIFAIRDAVPIASSRDLAFLKSVLYRYRDNAASITLKALHEKSLTAGLRPSLSVTGLLAVPRSGDPESHICDSIGGLAIAEYFDDEVKRHNVPSAMTTLHQALSDLLAGEGTR